MNKEKQQMLILTILVLAIVGTIAYFNIDRFKPRAIEGSNLPVQKAQLQVDMVGANELFARDEYKALTEFGVVPVRPLGLGNDHPFGVAAPDETQ